MNSNNIRENLESLLAGAVDELRSDLTDAQGSAYDLKGELSSLEDQIEGLTNGDLVQQILDQVDDAGPNATTYKIGDLRVTIAGPRLSVDTVEQLLHTLGVNPVN